MATLIENLYSKLKLMLVKKDENKNNALLVHLQKINDHLAARGTRFLTGDTMCCFDCELMPRLQHIRVAGKYFVDFDIPVSEFGDHGGVVEMKCGFVTLCFFFAETFNGVVAVHVPYVSARRIHAVLSSRSGYHQPLQTAAGTI